MIRGRLGRFNGEAGIAHRFGDGGGRGGGFDTNQFCLKVGQECGLVVKILHGAGQRPDAGIAVDVSNA
jgi:hypothetical protein